MGPFEVVQCRKHQRKPTYDIVMRQPLLIAMTTKKTAGTVKLTLAKAVFKSQWRRV